MQKAAIWHYPQVTITPLRFWLEVNGQFPEKGCYDERECRQQYRNRRAQGLIHDMDCVRIWTGITDPADFHSTIN